MKMSGAKMVIESLHQEGVEVVFGYPGGAIMNVYDEIYKQNYFEHILNRHEQACVIAAEGYARSTGKTGVAIVTSGPGFYKCNNWYCRCLYGFNPYSNNFRGKFQQQLLEQMVFKK